MKETIESRQTNVDAPAVPPLLLPFQPQVESGFLESVEQPGENKIKESEIWVNGNRVITNHGGSPGKALIPRPFGVQILPVM